MSCLNENIKKERLKKKSDRLKKKFNVLGTECEENQVNECDMNENENNEVVERGEADDGANFDSVSTHYSMQSMLDNDDDIEMDAQNKIIFISEKLFIST